MTASLLLTPNAGAAAMQLVAGPTVGLTSDTADEFWPVPAWEEEYADSPDTEGSLRTRSRATNPTTTGRVVIQGTTQAALNANVLLWEQTIEACRRNGATLVYTPTGGSAVTFTVLSAWLTSLPEAQPQANLWRLSDFQMTFAPFGKLAAINFATALISELPIFTLDLGDRAYSTVVMADTPSLYWRLGSGGTTDQSGNGRNGTAGGGITIGGQTAPGLLYNLSSALETDAATVFDGVDDRITSSYSPFSDAAARTYEGWAFRGTSTTNDAIMAGGGGVSAPSLTLLSGGNDVRYRIQDNSALATLSTTWTSGWPGNGVIVYWALIFDPVADTAELFINGRSKGVKTGLTGTHSTPGNFQLGAVGSAFSDPFQSIMDEVAVFESRLPPERIWARYQAGIVRLAIPGSADALVQVTLTDQATSARAHVEVGIQDNYDQTKRQRTLLTAAELTTAGFAGAASTRTGANDLRGGTATVRANLLSGSQGICNTGNLPNVGRFRIKARVYGRGTGPIYVRASTVLGTQAPVANTWVTLPFVNPTSDTTNAWYELDLGLVTIPTAPAGTQQAVIQLDAYTGTQSDTLDVNWIELVPASRYGKARSPASWILGAASGSDTFNQIAGPLTGKTADLGGNWATAGSAAAPDLTVDVGFHLVNRNSTADGTPGRFGYLPAAFTNVQVQCDVQLVSGVGRAGVLARYTTATGIGIRAWVYKGGLVVEKVTAGPTVTTLASILNSGWGLVGGWYTIALAVDTNGGWLVWLYKQGGSPIGVAMGLDADLAAGGALASGQAGIYDQNITATAAYRFYDNFVVWAPNTQSIISSGGSVRIDHQQALRNDSGVYSPVASYEGLYLKAHPGEVSRLAVKARRADVDKQNDVGMVDATQLDVTVTPRVHLLG